MSDYRDLEVRVVIVLEKLQEAANPLLEKARELGHDMQLDRTSGFERDFRAAWKCSHCGARVIAISQGGKPAEANGSAAQRRCGDE